MKRTYANMPYAVFAYQHHNKQTGALVTLEAKTDFALRTELVQEMGKKLAMHAAAFGRLHDDAKWLFDDSKTVSGVMETLREELGEPLNIKEVSVHGVNLGSCPIDGYK